MPAHIFSISQPFALAFAFMLLHFGKKLYAHRHEIAGAKWTIVAAVVIPTVAIIGQIILHKYSLDLYNEYDKLILSLHILSPPLFYLAYISVRFRETLTAVHIESQKLLQVTEEKREILANQNVLLEAQVEERTKELKTSLENLKATQSQLIQSEKMASLGELTAGIAHEIQNPLNFVNNFSEVSTELVKEIQDERQKTKDQRDEDLMDEILNDIEQNLDKVNHHGHRASDIVKGMLDHSRTSDGKKELTDINKLADEYLRLAYHGLRAKDKSFNADFELDLDEALPKVNVVPQDIGRVLLNLINNAFQAVKDVKKPFVKVSSAGIPLTEGASLASPKLREGKVGSSTIQITVSDNGPGIPDEIKDKIFQPFFTTKATGEGTGLGLSLSYDIITKGHGGKLQVQSEVNKGTKFIVQLNLNSTT